MKSLRLALAGCALALLWAGCASPASRIKKNPELFASFPPEAQALIQEGRIDLGFTPPMVEMALGKPNREYQRVATNGTSVVWSYTDIYTTTDRQRVETRVRYRDAGGSYRSTTDWVWVDVQQQHEYERLRVEFLGEAVTAIETLKR